MHKGMQRVAFWRGAGDALVWRCKRFAASRPLGAIYHGNGSISPIRFCIESAAASLPRNHFHIIARNRLSESVLFFPFCTTRARENRPKVGESLWGTPVEFSTSSTRGDTAGLMRRNAPPLLGTASDGLRGNYERKRTRTGRRGEKNGPKYYRSQLLPQKCLSVRAHQEYFRARV